MGIFRRTKQSFNYQTLAELGDEIVGRMHKLGIPASINVFLTGNCEIAIEDKSKPDAAIGIVPIEDYEGWLNEPNVTLAESNERIDEFVAGIMEQVRPNRPVNETLVLPFVRSLTKLGTDAFHFAATECIGRRPDFEMDLDGPDHLAMRIHGDMVMMLGESSEQSIRYLKRECLTSGTEANDLFDAAINRFAGKMSELKFEAIQPGFGCFRFESRQDASLASTAVLFPELFERIAEKSGFNHTMIAVPTAEEVFILGGSSELDVGPMVAAMRQAYDSGQDIVSSFIYRHDPQNSLDPVMHVDPDTGEVEILDDCVEQALPH